MKKECSSTRADQAVPIIYSGLQKAGPTQKFLNNMPTRARNLSSHNSGINSGDNKSSAAKRSATAYYETPDKNNNHNHSMM